MKAVLGFLELYLNDVPEEETLADQFVSGPTGYAGLGADSMSLDGASFSSRTTTTSTSCYGGPSGGVGPAAGGLAGGGTTSQCTGPDGSPCAGGAGPGCSAEGSLGSIYPTPGQGTAGQHGGLQV